MSPKKLRVVIFQEGEWLCAQKYWKLFRQSKIALPPQSFGLRIRKNGVSIPTPEIRVAALAA